MTAPARGRVVTILGRRSWILVTQALTFCSQETPMRYADRPVRNTRKPEIALRRRTTLWTLAVIVAALLAACSGGDPKETTSASPSLDPAQNPSIDKSFPVAPDGRKDALVCWGEG